MIAAAASVCLSAACGPDVTSDSSARVSSPPSESSMPTSATAPSDHTTSPVAPIAPEFVFDASTDIGLLPPAHYELSDCTEAITTRQAGDINPNISYRGDGFAFADVRAMLAEVDTIFAGTVHEVRPGLTFTPTFLPDSYLASTGLRTGADAAWAGTPLVVQVGDVLLGSAGPRATLLELGCLAEGSSAVLTPGSEVLVLARAVDEELGPSSLYGGTHTIVDWFSVDAEGLLAPRSSVLGLPSRAPFLVSLTMADAIAQLRSNVGLNGAAPEQAG